jgi:hypothetical protein
MLAALTNEMRKRGFTVYDESSVGIEAGARVHRTDAELISIAQRVPQPPVDAVVAVKIFANAQRSSKSDIIMLHLRITGRAIQVQTGKPLDNLEVASEPSPMPPACGRDCLLDLTGNEAQLAAPKVADALARQLDEQLPAGAKAGAR